jgi:hypothetical protein
VNEFIISNYKQTWASIGKLADAPEGVKQLSFKSLDYYGPLSPEERRKSRHLHLNIDTMGQRQNGACRWRTCAQREHPGRVWEYPLFDALFGRRSRRFGLVSR